MNYVQTESILTFLTISDQVILVYLVHLELVAHLEPPLLVPWGNLVHLDLPVQWDHQVRQTSLSL